MGNEFVTFYNWTGDVGRLHEVLARYSQDFPLAWEYEGRLTNVGDGAWRQVFRPRGELDLINLVDIEVGVEESWWPDQPIQIRLLQRVFLSEEPVLTYRVPVEHTRYLSDGWVRFSLPTTWLPSDSNYVIEIDGIDTRDIDRPAVRIGLNLLEERGHSQMIQQRGEAIRLLELFETELANGNKSALSWDEKDVFSWLEDSRRAYERGAYDEAIRLARIADGLVLPARFLLSAKQKVMLPFSLEISPSEETIMTVERISENMSDFIDASGDGHEQVFPANDDSTNVIWREVTLRFRRLPGTEGTYTFSSERGRPIVRVDRHDWDRGDKDGAGNEAQSVQSGVTSVGDNEVRVTSHGEEVRITVMVRE